MEGKRGVLSITFVVTTVLLIIGAGILAFLYFQFFSFGQIDREICHTSVILRATFPKIAAGYVPLKCPTQKICVTGKLVGKGECSEFENAESVITARVSNGDKGLNQVQKVYADGVLECWITMGEGKVDVFPDFVLSHFGVGKSEPSCVICSRIAIDKESLDKVNFENMDLVNYMQTYKVPGKEITYADFIAEERYSAPIKIDQDLNVEVFSLDDKGEKVFTTKEKTELEEVDVTTRNTKETAVLFMQIKGPEDGSSIVANDVRLLGGAATFSLFTAPIKTVTSVTNPLVWGPLLVAGVYQAGSVSYNRAVTASYCGDVPTSTSSLETGSKKGCSVVRTTDYKVNDILQYCKVIESIP